MSCWFWIDSRYKSELVKWLKMFDTGVWFFADFNMWMEISSKLIKIFSFKRPMTCFMFFSISFLVSSLLPTFFHNLLYLIHKVISRWPKFLQFRKYLHPCTDISSTFLNTQIWKQYFVIYLNLFIIKDIKYSFSVSGILAYGVQKCFDYNTK